MGIANGLDKPCSDLLAWLLEPGLFRTRECNLAIETESELTMGHTAVDFWHVTSRPANVSWAYEVDADGFYNLLIRHLERYGDA